MHAHFELCSIRVQHLGHHLISLDMVNPVLAKPGAGSRMSFRLMVVDDDYVVYRCPLDIFMLQMVICYDGLYYFYNYQHLQALLLLWF